MMELRVTEAPKAVARSERSLLLLLLQENEELARSAIATLLLWAPTTHVEAISSRAAMNDLIVAKSFDVIVADSSLSAWLADLPSTERSSPPVILLAERVTDELVKMCAELGAVDCVGTESLARLPLAIDGAMSRRRAIDESVRSLEAADRATKTAADHQQIFSELAENLDCVFYAMDADYERTIYISPAYEHVWGKTCESLYQNPMSFLEPLSAQDREAMLARVKLLQSGMKAPQIEFAIRRRDGTQKWVQSRAVPIIAESGKVVRISGVALDITEARVAARALQAGEERFRTLVETSFDAISIARNGKVDEVNPGFLRIFGYASVAEVVGRDVCDFAAEESRDEVARRVQANIDGSYAFVGLRLDGKHIRLEATGKCCTVNGEKTRITALRDVTERYALEDQFRQAQKMEAVGRLAGGVAHDFNNLLTVIMANTEMLQRAVPPEDARSADLLEIQSATRAAASLTRQLLAFSRQELVQRQVVTLQEIVDGTDKMLKRLIGEDIVVEFDRGPTPCTVRVDPAQIEQVIMNLAVNARDAMPNGGKLQVTTSTAARCAPYAERPRAELGYARLSVADTGIGMDAATRARIFEPFFTTKPRGQGTGLGLSTVFGIVKQCDGFLEVFSQPGLGTTFDIYLPLCVDQPTPAAESYDPEAVPTGIETILLVEDSEAVREVTCRALEAQGYEVIRASSGADALDILSDFTFPIHLLLTDVVMPNMSGRIVAEEFRRLYPRAEVLYMSGYTDDVTMRHGIERNSIRFLQKPFTHGDLARQVRQALDELPLLHRCTN